MSLFRFDGEQFFEETVATITTDPEYAKESSVPELNGTIPVLDLDFRERFRFLPCWLGYYPVSRSIEIGLLTLSVDGHLPRSVVGPKIALKDHEPFDGLVVAKEGFHTVIGLHAPGRSWRQVQGYPSTNRNLLEIIRRKAHHPWHRRDERAYAPPRLV